MEKPITAERAKTKKEPILYVRVVSHEDTMNSERVSDIEKPIVEKRAIELKKTIIGGADPMNRPRTGREPSYVSES